jgi:Uma2 family endonuclease
MAIQPQNKLLSVEEYLAGEEQSDLRHEYSDGHIYAMTGASVRHNLIASNTLLALRSQSRGSSCQVFMSDVKLRLAIAGKEIFYYPDLMVCCDPTDRAAYYRSKPCLIVEILSASTTRIDCQEKLFAYIQIESLQAYLIVSQETLQATLHRHQDEWRGEVFTDPQSILLLPCASGLELPLAAVYEGVTLGAEP